MQLEFMVTIVDRSMGEKVVDLLGEHRVPIVLSAMGKGTASGDILSLLGFGEQEKEVDFCITSRDLSKKIIRQMSRRLNIDIPGYGIVFTIPLASVCGAMTLKYYSGCMEIEGGAEDMQKTDYELIIAVVNRGYTDMVMETAREAGAGGGTVLHVKGTGSDQAEKFFGVSLAVEKEMLLIVAKSAEKAEIMKNIATKAGTKTKAGATVFSLPVSSIKGLRELEEDE